MLILLTYSKTFTQVSLCTVDMCPTMTSSRCLVAVATRAPNGLTVCLRSWRLHRANQRIIDIISPINSFTCNHCIYHYISSSSSSSSKMLLIHFDRSWPLAILITISPQTNNAELIVSTLMLCWYCSEAKVVMRQKLLKANKSIVAKQVQQACIKTSALVRLSAGNNNESDIVF